MRILRYIVLAGIACGALLGTARAADVGAALPEAFQGNWSQSAETCAARPEDTSGVRVTGTTISFYDGRASIRSVKVISAEAVEVEADWRGEGRTWSATGRLSLSQSGQMLTITGYGRNGAVTSVRCS